MDLLYKATDGSLSIRFMWLPTFIGMNVHMIKTLDKELTREFSGQELTAEKTKEINTWIARWLAVKFPIPGLDRFFEAVDQIPEV